MTESLTKVLNTSFTCGHVHQNDKSVVATFNSGLPVQWRIDQAFSLPTAKACTRAVHVVLIGSAPGNADCRSHPRFGVIACQWAVLSPRRSQESTVERSVIERVKRDTVFVYEGSEVCVGEIV